MVTALLWYAVVTGALAAALLLIMAVQAVLPHLHRSARALPEAALHEPFPAEPEGQPAYGHAAA